MTSEERQSVFFSRVSSDPIESRLRWAYPYDGPSQSSPPPAYPQEQEGHLQPASPARAIRNRNISINEMQNLPVEQQQQAHMNEQQWMRYIAEEIDQARRPVFVRNKTIFSVPRALFEVRPMSYCPRVVTIGPLCRKLDSSPMDRCKALCIRELMTRQEMRLDDLMDHLITDPKNLWNIYFGAPKHNIETLKLLLTMDAVFIHEFFLFMSRDFSLEDEVCGYLASFLNNQITISQVVRDLFLIGNQVPISFLRRITELPGKDLTEDVLLHCLEYLVWRSNPFCISHPDSISPLNDITILVKGTSFLDCEHLLDCLYIACVRLPDEDSPEQFDRPSGHLPTASNLTKVGIKFRACKGNTSVLRYDKKSLRLYLPKLIVFDETEDIFRNLIAYELTSKVGGEFCGYAIIMDSLIDTAEDLSILYRAGVLENHLGSDERLLRMWNEMCINISESSCGRWEVMTQSIMMHYKSNWRVMYVEFYTKFFSRPWLWISTIAALVLLAMSFLQTVYSVAAYYQH